MPSFWCALLVVTVFAYSAYAEAKYGARVYPWPDGPSVGWIGYSLLALVSVGLEALDRSSPGGPMGAMHRAAIAFMSIATGGLLWRVGNFFNTRGMLSRHAEHARKNDGRSDRSDR